MAVTVAVSVASRAGSAARSVVSVTRNPVTRFRSFGPPRGNRETKRQQSRVLNFEAIVEDQETDRGAALRVVGIRDSIDDRFAYRHRR
jgi:hypothetical protein